MWAGSIRHVFNFLGAAILTGTIAGLFIFSSSSDLLLTLLDLSTAPGFLVTEYNGIFALGSWRGCIWTGKATDNMDANFKLLVSSPRHLKRINLKEMGRTAGLCF